MCYIFSILHNYLLLLRLFSVIHLLQWVLILDFLEFRVFSQELVLKAWITASCKKITFSFRSLVTAAQTIWTKTLHWTKFPGGYRLWMVCLSMAMLKTLILSFVNTDRSTATVYLRALFATLRNPCISSQINISSSNTSILWYYQNFKLACNAADCLQ